MQRFSIHTTLVRSLLLTCIFATPQAVAVPDRNPQSAVETGSSGLVSWCYLPYSHNTSDYSILEAAWEERGMIRYRVSFLGENLIKNYGADFLLRIRCRDGGGVFNNWKCYQVGGEDGKWVFDTSEVSGPAGYMAVSQAVEDVTEKMLVIPEGVVVPV